MKICQEHWDKLRQDIDDVGLSQFISKDGKQASERLIKELKGEYTIEDPLMLCNNMIWSRSLDTFGLTVLAEDICPICYANDNLDDIEGENVGDYWLRTLVPYVKTIFIEEGLINKN